jgi:hypothetical protein
MSDYTGRFELLPRDETKRDDGYDEYLAVCGCGIYATARMLRLMFTTSSLPLSPEELYRKRGWEIGLEVRCPFCTGARPETERPPKPQEVRP